VEADARASAAYEFLLGPESTGAATAAVLIDIPRPLTGMVGSVRLPGHPRGISARRGPPPESSVS